MKNKRGPVRKDLSGIRFGKLIVLKLSHYSAKRRAYYLCVCDCGIEKKVRSTTLTNGTTTSCGCFLNRKRTKNPELLTPKFVWRQTYSDCTFEKFIELSQQNCYYCGSPPLNKCNLYSTRMSRGTISKEWFDKCWWTYNGLDRLDSNKSHTENNVVPCCVICNKAKNNMTVEEFKTWICKIYTNFIGTGNN